MKSLGGQSGHRKLKCRCSFGVDKQIIRSGETSLRSADIHIVKVGGVLGGGWCGGDANVNPTDLLSAVMEQEREHLVDRVRPT